MVRTFTIWKIWSRRYLLFTRERSINANDTGYNLSTFRIIDAKTYLINHFCRDRLQYIDPSQISSKIRIKNWFQKCLIPIILSLGNKPIYLILTSFSATKMFHIWYIENSLKYSKGLENIMTFITQEVGIMFFSISYSIIKSYLYVIYVKKGYFKENYQFSLIIRN